MCAFMCVCIGVCVCRCACRRVCALVRVCRSYVCMGGDLAGAGDGPPKKVEVGDGPCIRPAKYFEKYCYGM